MCGIAGFFSPTNSRADAAIHLQTMLDAIAHRGPDDHGAWFDEQGLALGHRRLSILDLSPSGHQPMTSHCGRYVMVFNGEIYNHLDLRQRLGKQIDWRGTSDTETLLACMTAWGVEAAVSSTRGMFALAVWDLHERALTLTRDRMGEKPLYYGWQKGSFLFGSELKSLKANPEFESMIDWQAAGAFLRLNYVPSPASIYAGVHKLLPGSLLRLTAEDLMSRRLPEPSTYWSLGLAAIAGRDHPFQGSFNDAVDELEVLVRDAVKLQSVADVPVGAFLSGGIDSSLVVAMMKSSTTSHVMTFSIGMPQASLDESQHAAAVARHLGTEHVAHVIQAQEALALIPTIPEVWDEPLGDSSQLPTFLVSQLAKQHVKVALSGDGGDELFLGYADYLRYQRLWRSRAMKVLPFYAQGSKHEKALPRKLQLLLNAWRQPDAQALCRYWMDRYRQQDIPLMSQEVSAEHDVPLLGDAASTAGLWNAATYLPDDILVKVDRASMANSLETRAPLLDHRIAEFSFRLPLNHKIRQGQGKAVLKEVLYRHVPKDILDRPKMGFSVPMQSWLRSELRPWAEDLLSDIPQDGAIFRKDQVMALWQESLSGQNHAEKLWGILSLLSFMRFNRIHLT